MGNKNKESIDKNQNNADEITKRLDKIDRLIRIGNQSDFIGILLEGKTPLYHKRFSAWCRTTLDSRYYNDFTQALLSMYAIDLLTNGSQFTDDFVKGQANNVLFMGEEMGRLSNIESFNTKE